MSMPLSSSALGVFSSKETFESVLQHWAVARIDGPMKVTERFDEAAKQLIVVGGLMQGLFFAVVALKNPGSQAPLWIVSLFFLPLIALVFCAAKVICIVPLKMEAINTYTLMRRAMDGVPDRELTAAVEEWCREIDRIAKEKHAWLFKANMLFLLSSVLAVGVLLPLIAM